MLLLIPVLLPVFSGTVILIKKWKKKPWRRPRYILVSALINSAVVLGFVIKQYSEAMKVAVNGSLTLWLSIDGLGSVLAGCMALLMPAILCYFLDFGEKKEDVLEKARVRVAEAGLDEPQMKAHTKREKKKLRKEKRKIRRMKARLRKTEGKRDVVSALLHYLFAALTGFAFAKNVETAAFFLIVVLLFAAGIVKKYGNPGKYYWILQGGGAAAVLLVMAVILIAGDNNTFYVEGYLSGGISNSGLFLLYILAFCGCSARATVYPAVSIILERRTSANDRKTLTARQADSEKEAHVSAEKEEITSEEKEKTESLLPKTINLLLDTVFAFLLIRLTFSVFGASLLRESPAHVVVTLISIAGLIFYAVMLLRGRSLQRELTCLCGASFALILTGISVMRSNGYTAAVWMLIGFVSVQLLFVFFFGAVREKCRDQENPEAGLGRQMPVTFSCFMAAILSTVAVAPLTGFSGVWKLAKAFSDQGGLNYISMAAMFSFLFLTVWCFYPTVVRAFFPKNDQAGKAKVDEAGLQMLVPMVALAAAVIAVGIFSGVIGEYIYEIGLGSV